MTPFSQLQLVDLVKWRIADNLHKAGWSYGYVSALDRKGRTIWIVDAHGYGKRFIVRTDELLTAFVNPNLRFAPAPNWLAKLARFLANSTETKI